MERGERAELLGDDERRVVGQHHAAGADANRLGAVGDVLDQDGGRRAGDAGHVVVLGQPEAAVAERLRAAREVERLAQRVGDCPASPHGREVENRKRNCPHDSHHPFAHNILSKPKRGLLVKVVARASVGDPIIVAPALRDFVAV